MDALPFDSTKYIDTEVNLPYLEPSIDSLNKYIASGNAYITIRITTTEDLFVYKDYDLESIDVFRRMKDAERNSYSPIVRIKIASLTDVKKSDRVIEEMLSGLFTFREDKHPQVFVPESEHFEDAFEAYDIRDALEIVYPANDNNESIAFME